MGVQLYRAGLLPAGRNRILPPRLDEGQTFYAPLTSNLLAIGGGSVVPTFTRASIATFKNGLGYIGTVGSGVPRFEVPGMLFEGARTNLAKYSDDYTQLGYWTQYEVSVTPDAAASPYVGATVIADKVTESINNDYHAMYGPYTGAGATQYDAMAVRSHAGERDWVTVQWFDDAAGLIEQFYNVTTGVVGSANVAGTCSVYSASMEYDVGGWWWLKLVVLTQASVNRNIGFGPAPSDGTASYAGTVGWGAYFMGAQAEANAKFASSLIPTGAATVTRAQDVLTYLASGNTPVGPIGAIECVCRRYTLEPGVTALATKDIVNQYGAEILYGVGTGQVVANVVSNATQQQALDGNAAADEDNWIVWSFRPFSARLYRKGVLEASTGTNSNLPYHSLITVGAAGSGGNELYGHVRNVKIWEKDITI